MAPVERSAPPRMPPAPRVTEREPVRATNVSKASAPDTFSNETKTLGAAAPSAPAGLPSSAQALRDWKGPMSWGRDVVLAEDQVARGQTLLQTLSPEDHARWERLVGEAPSDLHRAFTFKALAAAHTLDEVERFAAQISPMYTEELFPTLTLRNLIQQHGMSCEVTEGQLLMGERDPLYALEHRLANRDLSQVANRDPYAINWKLANEQRVLLSSFGGKEGRRDLAQGRGIPPERATSYWNSYEDRTGLVFQEREEVRNPAAAFDAIQSQLQKHIPTPMTVSGVGGSHAVMALPLEPARADAFELHDPYGGRVHTVTREQVLRKELPMEAWNQLSGYRLAEPAAVHAPHATEHLAELEALPPPPPPPRTVEPRPGMVERVPAVESRDAEGRFLRWVYPTFDYDWRGQPIVGSRRYEDVDGNVVQHLRGSGTR